MALSAFSPSIHPGLWRADQLAGHGIRTVASGHTALDAELPGGGWPQHALTELLLPRPGVGEIRLLAPALGVLCGAGRNIVLLGPPHLPYGPAWQALGLQLDRMLVIRADTPADRLWAAEQTLKSGGVGALLAWLPQARSEQLRRLQLAAQGSESLVFLLRPLPEQHVSSPAPLRLVCRATSDAQDGSLIRKLAIDIIKRRGPALAAPLLIDLPQPLAAARMVRIAPAMPPPARPPSFLPAPVRALDRTRVHAPAA